MCDASSGAGSSSGAIASCSREVAAAARPDTSV
jgi:hypothetical protein